MEEEILGEQEAFQVTMTNQSQNPDDIFFNQVVQALQEIVVDDHFQKSQTGFMRNYCHVFDNAEENKIEYMPIFQQYQANVSKQLEKMLSQAVPNFDMNKFTSMLTSHSSQIDQQIMEILISFSDFEVFKQLMIDYKVSLEEQQMYRVLTVKTNKIPEQKKVKGASDNIFAGSEVPKIGKDPLKKKIAPKAPKVQKTQQQILIPDLVLTIRPFKKQ